MDHKQLESLEAPACPWQEAARAAANCLGDVAVVTRVEPEQDVIVTVAVSHRDPAREEVARSVLGQRFRKGEAIPGRVWQSERGIWIVDVDTEALLQMDPGESMRYVREVGLQSMMLVPMWKGGRVVGTLGVARDPGRQPYTQQDFERLAQMAVLDPS